MVDNGTQFGNITNIVSRYKDRNDSTLYSKQLSEENVMSALFSSFSPNAVAISYMLKYGNKDVYADFGKSVKFYDAEFNLYENADPSVLKNIVSVDISYYCSQDIVRYVFLLDVLSEVYGFLAKESYDDNIVIRTRIKKVGDMWMQDINKVHTFSIKFHHDKKAGEYRYVVSDDAFAGMCQVFHSDIVRHLGYMGKVDLSSRNKQYTTNIRAFYMFCRLKLAYYVLMCCSKINREVGIFIEDIVSNCFINLKNHIEVKNVNNRSVVLTDHLVTTTNKLKQINNNIMKKNDEMTRHASTHRFLRYESARSLFYMCLFVSFVIFIVAFSFNSSIDRTTVTSSARVFALASVIVFYAVFSMLMHRNKPYIEQFSNNANSGLDWVQHSLVMTDLTRYPRKPLTDSSTVKQSTTYSYMYPNDLAFNHSLTTNRTKNNGNVGQHHAEKQYDTSNGNALHNRSFAGYSGDWIKIDVGESFVMKKVKFFCRDNFTNRSPGKFKIYGTNDKALFDKESWNSGWTLVHDQRTRLTGYTYEKPMEVSVTTQEAFSIYVMVVSQLSGNGTDCLNFLEWEMYGMPAKENERFPPRALESDATVKQSTQYDKNVPCHLLFNHNVKDNIGMAAEAGGYANGVAKNRHSFDSYYGDWVMIGVEKSFVLNEARFYSRNGYSSRAPGRFRIYATNDLSLFHTPNFNSPNWNIVHEQTSRLSAYQYGSPMVVKIDNDEAFSLYVLVVNQLSGDADILNFNEWEMYGRSKGSKVDPMYEVGDKVGTGKALDVSSVTAGGHTLTEYNGYFYTNEYSGDFTFYVGAGKGSFLMVNDELVVYSDGQRETTGVIRLDAHKHYRMQAKLRNNNGLSLQFSHNEIPKRSNGDGFYFYYYKEGLDWVRREGYKQYGKGKVISYGVDSEILSEWNNASDDSFNVEYTGYFFTKNYSGVFTFYTHSDDDSMVYIWKDGVKTVVVNNGGIHPPTTRKGSIRLEANTYYPMHIEYSENYGVNILSVFFEHRNISKTSNGKGHYFSVGYDAKWFDVPEDAEKNQQEKVLETERIAGTARAEFKKKAIMEREYADELEQLKMALHGLDKDAQHDLKKRIEKKQAQVNNAFEGTERARSYAESALHQEMVQQESLLANALSREVDQFIEYERSTREKNVLRSVAVIERFQSYDGNDIKRGELMAVKIIEASSALLVHKEDMINRRYASVLAGLKRRVEVAKKRTHDAVSTELAKARAFQKSEERILSVDEAKIRADIAKKIASLRRDHYSAVTQKLSPMKFYKMAEDDVLKHIYDIKKHIESEIREAIERRNIAIDVNKRLTETASNMFKENLRVEQHRYIASYESIDKTIDSITGKISDNMENVLMMISNSIVASSLGAEYREMSRLDEYASITSHRAVQGIDMTVRDTKITSASTRLVLNLFLVTMVLFIFRGYYSVAFGMAYVAVVIWFIIEVIIIVRTKSSNKYWRKPLHSVLSDTL